VNCNAHKPQMLKGLPAVLASNPIWLRGVDLNHRPLGYEPNELPDCSTPHRNHNSAVQRGQTNPTRQPTSHAQLNERPPAAALWFAHFAIGPV
jgi:hypothetical protein